MEQWQLPGSGSGIGVSALCLGTLNFGTTLDQRQAFALLDRFTEAGGTFIDTANTYAFWMPGGPGRRARRSSDAGWPRATPATGWC